MKKIFFQFILMMGVFTFPSYAFSKVNIFACEPEWASLSKEIGGDMVDIKTATSAKQNVHFIRAKPSLLSYMRKADLVFCSGSSLEIGWLPILLKKAAGPHIQPGSNGWIMASDFVNKIDISKNTDRSMGHVHPEGNPHIQLNPHNIQIISGIVTDRLIKIDPNNSQYYKDNLEKFSSKWMDNLKKWENKIDILKGKKVIVYHKSWSYLLSWLKIDAIASLEPKPGLPPTASHLEKILSSIKDHKKIDAILVAPFENDKAAKWLSEKSGIPIIYLPFTVGGSDNAHDLFSLFDETLKLLEGK